MFDRVFLIVCDSMGFGRADDAADFGDDNVDTIGHAAEFVGGLNIPNMERIGAGTLRPILGVKSDVCEGVVALLEERSRGKDTVTGHWEMMGIVTEHPFVVFTDTGFPKELISELERRTGRHVIGNKAASGTVILEELGNAELSDPKNMIVYTSADSVLQICGNEKVGGGLSELYRCCEIAREITLSRPEWKVGRVIARPYIKTDAGDFIRTSNRRDYSVKPPCDTVLDVLKQSGFDVISIGKIEDIFAGCGITRSEHSESSAHGMQQTIEYLEDKTWQGLCFTNLADFDVLWGHRRRPGGYAKEIEQFDMKLGRFMDKMDKNELVIITADHGNDPTAPGTDHTRENVPFLAWSPAINGGYNFGRIQGFDNIGVAIAENFKVELPDCYAGRNAISLTGETNVCDVLSYRAFSPRS